MNDYYFLASLLPPLEIGHVPALGFQELKQLMDSNLTKGDLSKVETFLSQIDLENIRALWAEEPLNSRGNWTKHQLEEALIHLSWLNDAPFPFYLIDYLEKYRSREERLSHFPLLISQFYSHMIENEEGFLRHYFEFQRELRLVMVGFRAKKWGRDIAAELQYEDSSDPIVAQILAQKDAPNYEPPFEYKELKPIFDAYADSPWELNRALYEYQSRHIIELWGNEPFTIDRILNYLARLILVERWLELDVQQGILVVDSIEKEIS
jgi:Protein of unknown function (DUF2764)